ncbi:MAG TPA: hypothetical protein PKN33_11030 [Phycisphaerae bacterium]|nr:hypothetical protein [Phycisphaerae bacterium]
MQVRRLSELKRTQAQMLVDMRAGQAVGALTADVDEPVAGSGLVLGRVEAVVASDEALGAHLVVAKLKASGTPATFVDDTVASRVYYPAPGKVVGDYAVDDFVLCCLIDGVRIALLLS